MKTYYNYRFKRNSECTNIVICQSDEKPDGTWVEVNESLITELKCDHLYTQAGVRYYGYL